MDFLRTLKKRRPKKHITARVNVAPATGDRPKSRGIRIRRRGTTLNLAFCFALFLSLAVVTQGKAEDYYIYETPNGELVISNKEPPPGSKIIKQLPGVTDREVPQAQEPGKTPLNLQTEGSPKPSKNK
jgi:hypothetical protein